MVRVGVVFSITIPVVGVSGSGFVDSIHSVHPVSNTSEERRRRDARSFMCYNDIIKFIIIFYFLVVILVS